jgi:hypothetical protein
MPCGEMAPTLQDVSYLLGLPIQGVAVGAINVPNTWRTDLGERFDGFQPENGQSVINPTVKGPEKFWILQFKVRKFQ